MKTKLVTTAAFDSSNLHSCRTNWKIVTNNAFLSTAENLTLSIAIKMFLKKYTVKHDEKIFSSPVLFWSPLPGPNKKFVQRFKQNCYYCCNSFKLASITRRVLSEFVGGGVVLLTRRFLPRTTVLSPYSTRQQQSLLYSWRFSRYSASFHWLVHGHMTSNNETVSRQMPWAGNIAKVMTSNGKQFTVTRSTVHCWPLLHIMAGISARFSNFTFVLFCYITNHLMTVPLGTSH